MTPCCISFDSYIKPQRYSAMVIFLSVVYLLIPTSNHNSLNLSIFRLLLYIFWFLHQTTTTNKACIFLICCISFDSYIKPQLVTLFIYCEGVVYLLIPTSNHNQEVEKNVAQTLYIFWFLHQTTTAISFCIDGICCISFDSYIKPQLFGVSVCKFHRCISFDSYIKPQPTDLNILIFSA